MRTKHVVLGSTMLVFAVSLSGLAADEKKSDAPKEESVVAFDSKTRGALEVRTVSENSNHWFRVEQNGKQAYPAAPPLLNSTIELAPGAYSVFVNRTERKVTLEAGKKTVLWTGELMVEAAKGSTDFYAPFQGKDKKVTTAEPVVNSPIPLFAGTYTVKVFSIQKTRDLGSAEVKPGQRTVLKE